MDVREIMVYCRKIRLRYCCWVTSIFLFSNVREYPWCSKKMQRKSSSATSGAGTYNKATARYCYLDLDLDDSRNAYKRACEFVDNCSIKYGLSSNILSELGGREKISILELVSNDFNYSSKGRVQCQPQLYCRLIFELFPETSPLACENFISLCVGNKGISKQSGLPLHYQNSNIHRYISNFIMQGGDFIFHNGSMF